VASSTRATLFKESTHMRELTVEELEVVTGGAPIIVDF
jgi:hypothetical protein